MKKVILLAVATVMATVGFSQVRFGVQAIGNAGSASVSSERLLNFKKKMQIGFGAGVVADIPLQNNLSVRSSLNFLQKKSSFEFTSIGSDNKSSVKTTLNYLELPVALTYKVPLNGMSLYFGIGPSFGYGISGKIKYQGYEVTEGGTHPVNETTDAFKKDADNGAGMKPFDISANANTGIQLKSGAYINAGYLLGLRNLGEGSDGKYKNRGILLTVGFLLP